MQATKQERLAGYARESTGYEFSDFLVKRVPTSYAKEFIATHHYSGGAGRAMMPWGVYDQDSSKLLGVVAFHTPISEAARDSIFGAERCTCGMVGLHKDCNRDDCSVSTAHHHKGEHVTELHRMAIHPDAPKNTATWLISRALDNLKEYKPKYWAVISMADTTEGHDGSVYQAANADYYGMSGTATYYKDEDGRLRSPRQCGENVTLADAKARGWEIVKRNAKHRYVFWLPGNYESKDEIRERAVIELTEYPE